VIRKLEIGHIANEAKVKLDYKYQRSGIITIECYGVRDLNLNIECILISRRAVPKFKSNLLKITYFITVFLASSFLYIPGKYKYLPLFFSIAEGAYRFDIYESVSRL
jgi:hypothetical protein